MPSVPCSAIRSLLVSVIENIAAGRELSSVFNGAIGVNASMVAVSGTT